MTWCESQVNKLTHFSVYPDVAAAIDLFSDVGQREPVAMSSSIDESNDSSLVGRARRGDRAAFGLLYERFARMIHGILLARVARHEAEDLVQDVFLSALRQLHTLRDDAAFPGWLAAIARNRARDHHRRAVPTTELKEDHKIQSAPETEALSVLSVLCALPEAYRETLVLRLVEGMTGDEIAARTGLRPASVRVNLHRGMKYLRSALGKEEPR